MVECPNPADTYELDDYTVTVLAVNIPRDRIAYQTRRKSDGHLSGMFTTTTGRFARLVENAR